MNESAVSTKIREEFKRMGVTCWKISDRFHASRPDLLFIVAGVTGYVEMKIYPSTPTELQCHTLNELTYSGAPVWVCQYVKPTKVYRLINNATGIVTDFSDHRKLCACLKQSCSSIRQSV